MQELTCDTFGKSIEREYSRILTDLSFERRLKAFDPNLRLMFDQAKERWTILEWNGQYWNILIVAQDRVTKEPRPLGDWVFNELFVSRHNYEEKRRIGTDAWLKNLRYEAEFNQRVEEEKIARDAELKIVDDIISFRKGVREIYNQPTSDVTAGYAKRSVT